MYVLEWMMRSFHKDNFSHVSLAESTVWPLKCARCGRHRLGQGLVIFIQEVRGSSWVQLCG